MDELDDGGGVDVLLILVAAGAGGQQHQQRPQTLAAGVNDVGGDLVDQRHRAVQPTLDDPIDGLKIGGDQLANLY